MFFFSIVHEIHFSKKENLNFEFHFNKIQWYLKLGHHKIHCNAFAWIISIENYKLFNYLHNFIIYTEQKFSIIHINFIQTYYYSFF